MAAIARPAAVVVWSAPRCRHPDASSTTATIAHRLAAALLIVTRRSCRPGVVWASRHSVTAR
jgi:hypothetical protein